MAFQYPWGNLQGLNLTWFINQFKKLREDWATAEAGIEGSLDAEIQKAEDALSDVFDARDAAAASATAAAGSASQAGTSATAAQNSATAAASSATLANNKATAAGLSEANAAQSASQAALSASNASNSATQAGNSATAAAGSATAAAGSATQAGNSATAAAGSATAAATSETNAAASAQEAENVLESIPADYSELSQEVDDLQAAVEDMATGIIETNSGEYATFTDGQDNKPVNSAIANIVALQEGTGEPSPTNVRNFIGHTGLYVMKSGKNMLIPESSFLIPSNNSKVSVSNGVLTAQTNLTAECGFVVAVKPNTTYKFRIRKLSGGAAYIRCAEYTAKPGVYNSIYRIREILHEDNHFTGATTRTVTTGNDARWLFIGSYRSYNTTTQTFDGYYIGLNSEYEGFLESEATYSIVSFGEAGTVYGGQLDITTGLLTVTHGYIASYAGEDVGSEWISNIDVNTGDNSPSTGAQVIYPLTVPVEYQLTPTVINTLAGLNHIWCNSGNITVKHIADFSYYVDSRDSKIKAIIAKELPDMIADAALAVNDFRIVNDTLYKITTPVAAGGTLTPGTNCTATTVTDVIKTLF